MDTQAKRKLAEKILNTKKFYAEIIDGMFEFHDEMMAAEKSETYYNEFGEWTKVTFPDAGSIEHLIKLHEEVEEAISNPNDIMEYADCLSAIFGATFKAGFTCEQLLDAAKKKFEINKTRKWEKFTNRTYQHTSQTEANEKPESTLFLVIKDGNTTRLYKNGEKISPEKFTPFRGCDMTEEQKLVYDKLKSKYFESLETIQNIEEKPDDEYKEIYIIMHSNKIWHNLYFHSVKQARNYIKMHESKKRFKEPSENLFVHPYSGARFEILTLTMRDNPEQLKTKNSEK